jgi:CheY-like chemotaxis protein
MTANAMQGDREECLARGMDGYVSKPIKRNELLEAIERYRPKPQPMEEATASLVVDAAIADSAIADSAIATA